MHFRIHKAHESHGETLSMNERFGVFITNNVGTMWCAYIFTFIGIASLVGAVTNNAALALTFGAVSSYFLQLVLLPIIMVGQSVEGRKNEHVQSEILQDTEKILRILQGIPEPTITIHSEETGADIIYPNAIRERFDDGEVTSLNDIV